MFMTVEGERTYAYTGARRFVPSQESIIFVHGGGLDHTVWVLQSRYFAHHARNVLAVDLPGHGRSEGVPCPSIGDYADWVIQFMDALGIEHSIVVGHSMGSLIALETGIRYPSRVSRIGLIGIAVPMPVTDALLDAAEHDDHRALDMINIWGHALGQLGGHRAPGMWMMGGALRLLERARPGVLHNDLRSCNEYVGGLDAESKVRVPTLLVLGEQDMMSPAHRGQELAAKIPNSRTVVASRCGHMLMAERPDEILEALIEFISND